MRPPLWQRWPHCSKRVQHHGVGLFLCLDRLLLAVRLKLLKPVLLLSCLRSQLEQGNLIPFVMTAAKERGRRPARFGRRSCPPLLMCLQQGRRVPLGHGLVILH